MAIASLYLAMVRRATIIPLSARIAAILLSLRGLSELSAATSFLIMARIAMEEHSPPVSVST